MKLLDRYIAISVIRASFMTLLVITCLLLFLSFVDEVEDVGTGNYGLIDAFLVSLLSVPRFVYEAFPVSALVGALLGLGGMASHGELVAMRAAGISLRHILLAVIQAGLMMMVLVFMVGELLAPVSEQYGQKLRLAEQQKQVTFKTKYGFWARDGKAFINVRRILPGARLEEIYIYEFTSDKKLILSSYAESAVYQGDRWILQNIRQSEIGQDAVIARELAQATWDSLLDPGLLSVIIVRPTMLPVWGLYEYIRFMRENGQSATNYEVAFWTKIATPFATVVMLILAVPFILGSLRSVAIGQRIFLGIMLGTVFYLLSRAFSYIAVIYELPAFLAAMLPLLVFLSLGIYLLRKVH